MTSDSSVHGLCWSFCHCCVAYICLPASGADRLRLSRHEQRGSYLIVGSYWLLVISNAAFFLFCFCASLPQQVLVVFVSRDVTAVDHYQCGLLAENSPAGEFGGLAAVREAPLLYLNETGRMLSCASLTIVMGVEPHCCCAAETKCSENASVCVCVCVCVCVRERARGRERSRRAGKFCQLSSWSREMRSELRRPF